MHTRAARLARASVTASVSTLVTAVSHAAAGGTAPHPSLLLVAFALALVFCLALTGRTLAPWRLLPAVAVSQAMLHSVFAMSGPAPASILGAGGADSGGMAGMTHAMGTMTHGAAMPGMAEHGVTAGSGALAAVGTSAHAAGLDVGMLLAHVLAGLVTVLALTAGERAFWGLFGTLRLAGSALLRFVTATLRPPALPTEATSAVIAGNVFRPRMRERRMLALRHRGPPVLAF